MNLIPQDDQNKQMQFKVILEKAVRTDTWIYKNTNVKQICNFFIVNSLHTILKYI
jgi:hypothetical protein